jgi:hypothetical protein
MSEMCWPVSNVSHSYESSRVLTLRFWTSFPRAGIRRRTAWQRRVEVHSLGWCKLGRREMGTWIVVRVGKPMKAWVLTGLGSQLTLSNCPCGFIALAWG